jgi:hypothetical protein
MILNENVQKRNIISEGLNYHITNNKPLIENIYRPGSDNYFQLWKEARTLYSRNLLEIDNDDDLDIILNTNLGEYGLYLGNLVPLDFPMIDESLSFLHEAEYKGKEVQLNKPKRGGSKKFYVYVRDPKTKRVKKVSFGAAGGGQNLAVKIRDPKARRAFAKRQQCDRKKDRTTPGFWSCNIGKYWKSLGGGSNFSGYW